MKVAITGHMDIERCFGVTQESNHQYHTESFNEVYNSIAESLIHLSLKNHIDFRDLVLISGMARGVDEIFAKIAMEYELKLIISVPKSVEWHKNKIVKDTPHIKIQAIDYDEILAYDKLEIVEVTDNLDQGNYGYFLARNQSLVDLSDFVLAYQAYDSLGTSDCIARAKEQNKYLGNTIR